MAFNSYFFILCFMPLTVAIFYLVKKLAKPTLSKLFLLLASLFFIGYADLYSLVFLVASAIITYLISRLLTSGQKKLFLTLGIILNVASLGYIKYSGFIVDNLNKRLHLDIKMLSVLVPIGISFLCFQQIMYLVDTYRGEIEDSSVLDYALYIAFFPKLVQGPITEYKKLIGSIDRSLSSPANADEAAHGLWLFSIGLAKKVLLADVLSGAVKYGWDSFSSVGSLELLLATLCYTFQIYFDFSGYSSMAIGVSKMMNIELMENFSHPYQSLSIGEFWERWHISLTSFLRKYVYFPLGGNRKGKIRTYINIMIVFLVSGIWHGASWTFIFWGLMHGVAQCIDKLITPFWNKVNAVLRWAVTFIFVNTAWIFFRSESVTQAFTIIGRIFQMEDTFITDGFLANFDIKEMSILTARIPAVGEFFAHNRGIYLILYITVCFVAVLGSDKNRNEEFKPGVLKVAISSVLMFLSIISLSTVVEFIYGGF